MVLGVVVLITSACCGTNLYRHRAEWDPTAESLQGVVIQGGEDGGGCTSTLPPETFQESDLVGMWVAKEGTATDTLIVKTDHVYKQIYSDPVVEYHFESDWQRWWVEHRESGIPYLHLQGMRKCDRGDELCRRDGGGGGSDLWFDFCEERLVQMRDEVILLVLGVPPNSFVSPPRGILLHQLTRDPDGVGSVFELQLHFP